MQDGMAKIFSLLYCTFRNKRIFVNLSSQFISVAFYFLQSQPWLARPEHDRNRSTLF